MTLRMPTAWGGAKVMAAPAVHTARRSFIDPRLPHARFVERSLSRVQPVQRSVTAAPLGQHVHSEFCGCTPAYASDTHTGNDTLMPGTQVDLINQGERSFDAEKDQSLVSQLDYATWLPFCAKAYHISPNIEDYVIVSSPICPSDLPNRNGIGFPLAELVKFQPPPVSRMAYKAWTGTPVHLEHDNEDCTKAYGVMLDAALHKIEGYGGGNLWKVMGLAAIDKNKHPDIAQKILSGELNTYSMGALVDSFSCSFCGTPVSRQYGCHHVQGPDVVNWNEVNDPLGSGRHIAFLNAHGISPIEYSIVADPAWTTALSDNLLPSMSEDRPIHG